MKGIVTLDDIVDVVREEATEDIQKIGGTDALDAPYLDVGFAEHDQEARGLAHGAVHRRDADRDARWATSRHEIARAVVLALFVPLVISSGGNSGSQATTLVIRAMALGEVRLRDWWRVVRREFISGLALGAHPGDDRRGAHPHLAGALPHLRAAPSAHRAHRGDEPGRGRALGHAGGLDAAVPAAAARARTRRARRRRSWRRSWTSPGSSSTSRWRRSSSRERCSKETCSASPACSSAW